MPTRKTTKVEATQKTLPSGKSVKETLAALADHPPPLQADAKTLLALMKKITGEKPVIWGESIFGFGRYDYRYKSGHSGTWFLTGFSARLRGKRGYLSIHIMPGLGNYKALLDKLGPHKHGVSCLYINQLTDIDISILEQLIAQSIEDMRRIYPTM